MNTCRAAGDLQELPVLPGDIAHLADVRRPVEGGEDLNELITVVGPRSQAGLKVAAEQRIASLRQATAQLDLEADTGPAQSLMDEVRRMEQVQGDDVMRQHLERLREIARKFGGVR